MERVHQVVSVLSDRVVLSLVNQLVPLRSAYNDDSLRVILLDNRDNLVCVSLYVRPRAAVRLLAVDLGCFPFDNGT
jgi:hypothetical protein